MRENPPLNKPGPECEDEPATEQHEKQRRSPDPVNEVLGELVKRHCVSDQVQSVSEK
jgi:hypothetical protein